MKKEVEEVVSIEFGFDHFSVIWSVVAWTARLLGRDFVCLCVKWYTDERWQWAISLCRVDSFVCLLNVTETERRCHSDKMSLTDGGAAFSESQSCPSVFLSSVHPSVLPHSYCIMMGVWGNVNEGVGCQSLPSFISVCLSIYIILCSLCMLRFWIPAEDGCAPFTNHGLRLNPECPLRESIWWEEGMGWILGWGWEEISLHPYI